MYIIKRPDQNDQVFRGICQDAVILLRSVDFELLLKELPA